MHCFESGLSSNTFFCTYRIPLIIDADRGGGEGRRGGIKVYPPSKIFAKLFNKNAIKHQKGVPSLPKFGKNLTDPPSGFSNRVHLCP
jgi:hypothetical protein